MSRQPTRNPRSAPTPTRTTRPRGSVLGPPPGTETGTGYINASSPSASSTAPLPYRRPPPPRPPPLTNTSFPPRVAGPSILRNGGARNARPDPNVFDPIPEEFSPRRTTFADERPMRRRGTEGQEQSVMFYPSNTTSSTLSLVESELDEPPPMPFFRTEPQIRVSAATPSPRSSQTLANEGHRPESHGRSASMASSGVLGLGVDLDSNSDWDDDEGSASDFSVQSSDLVREVSLVRRGQARIMRNPSARRSVVPEVHASL